MLIKTLSDIELVPVDKNHIEWLRAQRNRPELYKYFRQDKPITLEEQQRWWNGLNRHNIKLFMVRQLGPAGEIVGCVGFNPLNSYAMRAELNIFIIPEHQKKGYGKQAIDLLLKNGFDDLNLRLIYSDVLDYPGENRFGFYKKMGFVKYSQECQYSRYKKQGKWISAIRFFMTKDMYDKIRQEQMDLGQLQSGAQKKKRGRPRKYPRPDAVLNCDKGA